MALALILKAAKGSSVSNTSTFYSGLVDEKCNDDLGITINFDENQLNETF